MPNFEDDDRGYTRWLRNHPNGYVLNYRIAVHEPDNLILHSATCGTITPRTDRNWTHYYGKECSNNRRRLEVTAEGWRGEAQPHACLSN